MQYEPTKAAGRQKYRYPHNVGRSRFRIRNHHERRTRSTIEVIAVQIRGLHMKLDAMLHVCCEGFAFWLVTFWTVYAAVTT